MKTISDPWGRSILLAGALAASGAAALAASYLGVSRTVDLVDQVSFAMSGGFGGLALLGVGIGLYLVQKSRYGRAVESRDLDIVASEFRSIAETLALRASQPPRDNLEAAVADRQQRRRAQRRAARG